MTSPTAQIPDISEEGQQKLARLETYLEHDPDNISLINSYLAACLEGRCYGRADALLGRVLEKCSESPDLNAHAGLLRMLQGQFMEAETLLARAKELGLEDSVVEYNLAYSKFLLGKFDESVELLEAVVEPARDQVLLLARALHHTGGLEKALFSLNTYLKAHPDDAEMLGMLALISYDAGKPQQAIEAANKALEMEESAGHEALLARGSANIELGNFDRAMADLLKTVESYPASGRALSALGQLHFREFQFDAALENLDEAVVHMPNHIGTWHLKGWAHLMRNEVEAAFDAFQKSYELDRNFGETHGGFAAVYALRGEVQQANKHLKLAEKLAPHGFAAVYARMVLLNLEGKGEDALALMNQVANTPHPDLGVIPQDLINARMGELQNQAASKKTH